MKGFQRYALDERCLNLSLADVFNGKRLPPVFDAPVVRVKNIGVEKEVVYVAWPLETEDGLTQILRANGQLVWIGDNAIRPLHIAGGTKMGAECRGRGTVGSHLRLIPAFPSGIKPEPERNSSCLALAGLGGRSLERQEYSKALGLSYQAAQRFQRLARSLGHELDRGSVTWQRWVLAQLSADNFELPKPRRRFAWSNGRSVRQGSRL